MDAARSGGQLSQAPLGTHAGRAGAVTRARRHGRIRAGPMARTEPTRPAARRASGARRRPAGRARPPRSSLASGAGVCPADSPRTDAGDRSAACATSRTPRSGAMDAHHAGPTEPGAAAPSIARLMLGPQRPSVGLHVVLECALLTLDGAFVVLLTGRDARHRGRLPCLSSRG